MSNYRRLRIPGATYFFSVRLAPHSDISLVSEIDLLRCAYAATHQEQPFRTDAIVVLPDHLHAVWTLPPGDSDFSNRWRKIKARFTRRVGKKMRRSASKVRQREAGIWQRRFWEHAIRNEADEVRHVHYCWSDPVQHQLVSQPALWPHSSIHRDMQQGLVSSDWSARRFEGAFGE